MSAGISILLATRGRTDMLKRSLLSLADTAHDTSNLEILLAFDDDDTETYEWVAENVLPELDSRGVAYSCMSFERMGYIRLNEYYNALSAAANGDWLFFWGDDAIMETADWDTTILTETRFRVLRAPAHNYHPIAIFPIVPKKWYELFGYFSAHQLNDNWVSQVAYMIVLILLAITMTKIIKIVPCWKVILQTLETFIILLGPNVESTIVKKLLNI